MGNRRRRAALVLLVAGAVALLTAPAALAAAGGGSSGFGGGGGGGGHGGNGFALYLLFDLLIHIAVLGHGLGALVLLALFVTWLFATRVLPKLSEAGASFFSRRPRDPSRRRSASSHAPSGSERFHRRAPSRGRRAELAAAEAAESDPAYAADRIRGGAAQLFLDVQSAWDADDRVRLRGLVGPDLLLEWERRLDDFARRGWRNRVQPLGQPGVELVGLRHTGEVDTDHVVVLIEARLKDYVVDRHGRHRGRSGRLGETTRIREFWTLGRRGDHWVLVSLQDGREGRHALDEPLVATPWGDSRGLRDAAVLEGAADEAVAPGTSITELVSLSYADDARAAAADLSLADGRFAPAVLEVAVRRALDAWVWAIDGADDALRAIATPEAVRELLYGGDGSRAARIVVRGPEVRRLRVVGLDAGAAPPTLTAEIDLHGRRYVEHRDTAALLAGSRTRPCGFTERWTFSLTGDPAQPWRLTAVAAPVGLR